MFHTLLLNHCFRDYLPRQFAKHALSMSWPPISIKKIWIAPGLLKAAQHFFSHNMHTPFKDVAGSGGRAFLPSLGSLKVSSGSQSGYNKVYYARRRPVGPKFYMLYSQRGTDSTMRFLPKSPQFPNDLLKTQNFRFISIKFLKVIFYPIKTFQTCNSFRFSFLKTHNFGEPVGRKLWLLYTIGHLSLLLGLWFDGPSGTPYPLSFWQTPAPQ